MTLLLADSAACRSRQRRLLEAAAPLRLDSLLITRAEHVQWLTGCRFSPFFAAAVVLDANGHCRLIAPNRIPEGAAIDGSWTYPAQFYSTMRADHWAGLAAVLSAELGRWTSGRRLGVEFAACPLTLSEALGLARASAVLDIEPALLDLRRAKDADELACLRRAIAATGAMYAAARELIRPGVMELDVFNRLQQVAVETCGEMLLGTGSGTGNDYASGVPGGPPRVRAVQAGELYILDLGPAYRGYFADNCRAFAVDGCPTDPQRRAWERIASVFPLVERMVRPGVSCREVYAAVHRHLADFQPGGFEHHLGHGIGLWPHEAPRINPHWDDHFAVGDVVTFEPGLYGPHLAGGIRLENDYLVTESGLGLLSDFPLEL